VNPWFQPDTGRASTVSEFMHGEVTEVLIFNRELTQWERDTLSINYLNKRFNLW